MISSPLRPLARPFLLPLYGGPIVPRVPIHVPPIPIPTYRFIKPNSVISRNPSFSRFAGSTATARVALHSSMSHIRAWMMNKNNILRLASWGGAGGTTVLALGETAYTYFCNRSREHELDRAFSKGAVPPVALENFVERPGISKTIASVLQPPAGYNCYDMIVGYHGTGKTTLVRHVGHQCSGIIYVNVVAGATSAELFSEAFAKGIHWTSPRRNWITVMLGKLGISREEAAETQSLWSAVFADFSKRAEAYRKATGHCAVLVIDNVNRLAVANPSLLQFLQDLAKDAADDRSFITVFVTSEGQAPIQMLSRSARSRLGEMVHVCDISSAEVNHLLLKTGFISTNLSQEIYDLVGGRIKYIERVITKLECGVKWEVIRHKILKDAERNFKQARLSVHGEYFEIGLRISARILKDGQIDEEEFESIAGTIDVAKSLLSSNVFSILPESDCVTFSSKPAEHVAREMLSRFPAQKTARSRWWW